MTEQQTLRISFAGILVLAVVALGFGLVSGSAAIVFDGVFSLVDAVMSLASIWVAGLVARSATNDFSPATQARFRHGFWHLEPMLLVVNAVLMMGVAAYAAVQSVQSLLQGGREIQFGPAIGYTVVVIALTTTIAVVEHRANRRLDSALVALDVKGWVMGGAITGALLVAFVVGLLLEGTDAQWLTPYVDPLVLLVVAGVLLPVPVGILRSAMADLLWVTPQGLQQEAETAVAELVGREGFVSAEVHSSKMGRSREVQVLVRVPPDQPPRRLEEWDELREPLRTRLGDDDPHTFVTITFTTR